jgi:hypothetical protein
MLKVLPPGITGQDAFALPGETDPRAAEAIVDWVCRLPGGGQARTGEG